MNVTAPTETDRGPRKPLSTRLVLDTAVTLADTEGIDAVTMRRLASELGVEAMSLYHHVANKEAILAGLVETVMEEINEATATIEDSGVWKETMRRRVLTAREILLRHRWAPAIIEHTTTMSPAMIRYFDGVVAIFRSGGFSHDLAHHALHALGSRALGFTQELFAPDDVEVGEEEATAMMEAMAAEVPHLVEMLGAIMHDDPDSTLGWCDDQTEFEFGLDIMLDGLDRLRNR